MSLNVLLADSDGDPEEEALQKILGYDVTHVETSEEAQAELRQRAYQAMIIEPYRPNQEWTAQLHAARFIRHASLNLELPVIIYTSESIGKLAAYLELTLGLDYATHVYRPQTPEEFCRIISNSINDWNESASTRKWMPVRAERLD